MFVLLQAAKQKQQQEEEARKKKAEEEAARIRKEQQEEAARKKKAEEDVSLLLNIPCKSVKKIIQVSHFMHVVVHLWCNAYLTRHVYVCVCM
jgi:hypothetical protein